MEVVLALLVFLMMIVLVAAVIPVTVRLARSNADYNQSASLVLHKLSQLQEAGYQNMSGPALGQNNLAIVDGTPTTPASNLSGDQASTFEFTQTDLLWQYFSGGMDDSGDQVTGSRSPHGYLYIAPYPPSATTVTSGSSTITVYGLIRVTVTIQWWTAGGQMQSFSATALLPRASVN